MLDDKQFVEDCLRTESQIEKVKADPQLLGGAGFAFISIGAILDQIKKNAFYGKPYSQVELAAEFAAIVEALDMLKEGIQNIEDESRKVELEVNPRMFHAIVGIATESTELVEALDMEGGKMDYTNISEEIGDLGWYQAIALDEMNTSLENSYGAVVAKLKKRYGEKFTSEAAINRDTDAERVVLEEEQDISDGC